VPFTEVASSSSPASVQQWFNCAFALHVRNDGPASVTLSKQTSLSFGGVGGHPFESTLDSEVVIAANAAANLSFAKKRVCGLLAANTYHPRIVLSGIDANGNRFDEVLQTTGNPVTVTAAVKPPSSAIGMATDFVFTMVANTRYRLAVLILLPDAYPRDCTILWQDGPDHFRAFTADGAPMGSSITLPDVSGSTRSSILLEPEEDLAISSLHRVGTLVVEAASVACPHAGGLSVVLGPGGVIRGRVIDRVDLGLIAAAPETGSNPLAPGEVFHLNVCFENPNDFSIQITRGEKQQPVNRELTAAWRIEGVPYGVNAAIEVPTIEPAPTVEDFRPTAAVRAFAEDGQEVSHLFAVEAVLGTPGAGPQAADHNMVRGIVTLVVRVDKSAPRGRYYVYPFISCYLTTTNENTDWFNFYGGASGYDCTPRRWAYVWVENPSSRHPW